MQKILFLILILLSTVFGYSQFNLETSLIYGGNSGDEAMDIAVSLDSNSLFFGVRTFSSDGNVPGNNGGSDFWIMKSDLNGNLIWNKNFGGFNSDDLAAIMPHSDGGVLAFGTTRNEHGANGDLIGLAGAWLIRTNSMGTLIKGKIFGEEISENGIDAIRHSNGTVTMAIEASSLELDSQSNHGILDVWIVQVDANFNIRWTTLLGGSRQDNPAAITTDASGNIYVAATSQSNLPGLGLNAGEKDLWVFKLDPSGDLLWQKNFGGSADDIANDILFDPSGNVFVMAQSTSSNGDFSVNRGNSDLWLIKLDAQTGAPVFFKNYGGESIEANSNLTWYGKDHFAISATTNSDSFDLSANKGFNDVWFFTVNLSGAIQYEMNYGGSLNDLAGELVSIDSIVYLLSTSLSSDKNVPANGTSQADVWFLSLNGNPERCSDQYLCEQDSTLSNELFPPSTDVLICVGGCTAGLPAGPDFNQGTCPDFIYPTAYFKLTTDANVDLLTLSIASDEFNKPHLALLRSGNCTSFIQVACVQGSDGSVILQYIEVQPLTTYIIAISDADGHIGEFELCATAVNVEFCNEKDSLYVTSASRGSPLTGPFLPGELVQICYELQDWNKIDCNGFQGLIPTFGPGWDPESFDIYGMPVQTDTMLIPTSIGFWDWYRVGDVHYNLNNPIGGYQGGQGMPAGWFYTNTADVPPNDGPDQTPGDIDDCLPTPDKWKVCFTLQVEDECLTNMDVSVSMRTFSDGELGVNTSLACAYDQEETLNIGMVCCINPTLQAIPEFSTCSGDPILLFPHSNILGPVTYSWVADPDIGVEGASSGNEVAQFYQILTNETNTTLNVNYILWAEAENCEADPIIFTVHVYPKPTSRITITGPSTVCSGTTVRLNFESTGTPPFAIELTRDNIFFANVLSESSNLSIDIDPVLSGRFRIGSLRDFFCEGEGQGFVNVTVLPVSTEIIDTSLCEGGSIQVGIESFDEAGTYIIRLENAAQNNCDSIVSLSLNFTPSMTTFINEEICFGDTLFVLGQPYTQTTHELIGFTGPLGCPDFIQLDLVVTDTFIDEFDQTICGGDTLEFEGVAVFETGSYSHIDELSPGCFALTILNLTVLPELVINELAIIHDNGNNTGAILVEFTGGTPPYTFLWSTGQQTGSLFNIMHGAYSLTVTDHEGCPEVFTFVVPMGTGVNNPGSHHDIQIWPTPVSSGEDVYIFNSNSGALQFTEISWWDTNGRMISRVDHSQFISSALTSINIPSQVIRGLYLIRLKSDDGDSSWHKVVVEQ